MGEGQSYLYPSGAGDGAVVITGANRGIGLALCRVYHERGADVIALCRTASPELVDLGVRILDGVDFAESEAIPMLANALQGQPIGLLINNAGVIGSDRLGDLERDRLLAQFAVNTVAPVMVTDALAAQLAVGGKVVFISSIRGSLAENTTSGRYGYRMSKAALNMGALCLAHDLKARGISVATVHPGSVGTGMSQGQGYLSPEESARAIMAVTDQVSLANTGCFWDYSGQQIPW